MNISSLFFQHNQMIPARFTCQGEDINPALVIDNIPEGTKCLTLIMDDPDAPMGTWVHWVVFDIQVSNLTRFEIKEKSIPGLQGHNDFGRNNYGGPCPPSGMHRYFFKIYALDADLKLKEGSTKQTVEKAMAGHILAKTELIGLYQKRR